MLVGLSFRLVETFPYNFPAFIYEEHRLVRCEAYSLLVIWGPFRETLDRYMRDAFVSAISHSLYCHSPVVNFTSGGVTIFLQVYLWDKVIPWLCKCVTKMTGRIHRNLQETPRTLFTLSNSTSYQVWIPQHHLQYVCQRYLGYLILFRYRTPFIT